MTGQQSRPGNPQAAEAFSGATEILGPDRAHLFGIGMSELDRRAVTRRAMASLAECWPQVVAEMVRRATQQAFTEAMPAHWIRRAEELERVGTPWADRAAVACRRHAWILATEGLPPDLLAEVDDLLGVV